MREALKNAGRASSVPRAMPRRAYAGWVDTSIRALLQYRGALGAWLHKPHSVSQAAVMATCCIRLYFSMKMWADGARSQDSLKRPLHKRRRQLSRGNEKWRPRGRAYQAIPNGSAAGTSGRHAGHG